MHKLKPRSFYKSAHLQDNLVDFHLWCELYLTVLSDYQVCCCFWAVPSAKQSFSHFKVQMAFFHHNSSMSTLVLPLGISFNTISHFSDNLTYPPNALQHSRHIHQKDQSFPRSPSYTIQSTWTVLSVSSLSIVSVDNDLNWEDAPAINLITNQTSNKPTSFTCSWSKLC